MKIAIIGAGNMGGAVLRGIIASGNFSGAEIVATVKSEKSRRELAGSVKEAVVLTDNGKAVENADIVIYSVKPWLMEDVILRTAPQLSRNASVVSLAAGVECSRIAELLERGGSPRHPVFRVVPNTPARVRAGVTFISCDEAYATSLNTVVRLFEAVGEVMVVDEKRIPAFTAIASCGVAMALRYIRACMEAGIELGLFAEEAKRVAALTVEGTAKMLLESGDHPELEIDRVTTPGGITIKGINRMEHEGFSNAVIEGFKACVK